MRVAIALLVVVCCVTVYGRQDAPREPVAVGSKMFTESIVLGEILAALAEHAGAEVRRRMDLGGTQLVFEAIKAGEIDAYVDYTGTLLLETYAGDGLGSEDALRRRLADDGLEMIGPIGFNNSYGVGVRQETARALGLRSIGDLARHEGLSIGMNSEFLERADGWDALRRAYALPPMRVVDATHDLAYLALAEGETDVMIVYTTDAKIGELSLAVLEDDKAHFPRYDAVIVMRRDLRDRSPGVVASFERLVSAIGEPAMIEMNRRAEAGGLAPGAVAAGFVSELVGADIEFEAESRASRVWRYTREHMVLVAAPTLIAIVIAVPLGFVAAHSRRFGQIVLGAVAVMQTIPSLALLVMLVPLLAMINDVLPVRALGPAPAIIALSVYSLLPVVRNTHAGVTQIASPLRESAAALGLSWWSRLITIEAPLASPVILAGVKTAAVINVGYATLGGFVAAGGYGTPILTWTRTQEHALLLEGAVPAMVMALAVQGLFEGIERITVPRGLRRDIRARR